MRAESIDILRDVYIADIALRHTDYTVLTLNMPLSPVPETAELNIADKAIRKVLGYRLDGAAMVLDENAV